MPVFQILIIDDFDDIVEEFVVMLELLGFSAIGAATLDEGIATLKRHETIEVIISDVRLPGHSGFELVDAMKTDPVLRDRHLSCIFMSGEMPISNNSLAYPVMAKPLDMARLLAELQRILGGGPPQ
jgi:DNA-binding NtrC family response regulator